MSPGAVLAIVLVALTAQAARVLLPGRGSYPLALLLSVIGLVTGEVAATASHYGGLQLGVLHVGADVGVIAVFQIAAAWLTTRRYRRSGV